MKKISTLLWVLGVLPLSSMAVEGALNQLDAEVLYSNDVLLNTSDGLRKITTDRYLQNLLYSRVNMMNKSDHENWYQHSEFGKFILSLAGQHWLGTEFGKEWIQKHQWIDWLQQNAKNTWVFNNAAITWLNSNAALNWVKTDVGKKQFSELMAHCHQYGKAHSVYTSDCEVLKKTKAGDDYYRKDKPILTNSDDFMPGGDVNLQNQGYTDSGFQDPDFGNGDNPSFDPSDRPYTSLYDPNILDSNPSMVGGAVITATTLAAAGGVALYNRLQNTSTVVDESENEVVRELRQCVEVGNTLACPLEREADTRTLMRDVERQWDVRVNRQPLTTLLNNQLEIGIRREYLTGTLANDEISRALELISTQAANRARLENREVQSIPQFVRDEITRTPRVISINTTLKKAVVNNAGEISEDAARDLIVNTANGLQSDETRLFPILRRNHYYLIAVHRNSNRDYQILLFDSAWSAGAHRQFLQNVETDLTTQSNHAVHVSRYSQDIQVEDRRVCGFYVTYLAHRLVNNGFTRTLQDLGLIQDFPNTLFGVEADSPRVRAYRHVWLRNYFSQLYQLRNHDNNFPQDTVAASFLNNISRSNGFNDIASLTLLAYQYNTVPDSNGSRDDTVLSNTLLQSIGNAQGRVLSDSERRLILEAHQGVTAPLTNSFIEKVLQSGIEVGLDAVNKKVTADVILDKNHEDNPHIQLSLEIPVKSAESEEIVGNFTASANISIEVATKMTKGKQQRKLKNQGYVVPYRYNLAYKDITMAFAKSDVVSL